VGVGAMDAGEARTQEALVAALRVRPRTTHGTIQCRLGGRGFILNRALKKKAAPQGGEAAPLAVHRAVRGGPAVGPGPDPGMGD
jgi:hypothetical protein